MSGAPASGRARIGMLLQVAGRVLMPVAVLYDLRTGALYSTLILATMGLALLLMGRHLRGA